jgi:hypothetical protein
MKETTAGIAAAQAALPSAVNILAEIDTEAIGGVKFRTDKAIDRYQTFVHLKHALEGISSPDAKDRINHANVEFEMVLSKLLSLLRLFSYSKPLNKIVPQAETVFSETSDNDNAITSSGGIEELNASALTGMTLDDPSSNAAAVSDPANGHPSFATDTVASFNGDVTASSGVATDGPSGSASSVVAADIAL